MDNRPLTRFLQQTLMPGERVVMRADFHWVYTLRSFLIACMFVGMGLAVQWIMHALAVHGVAGTPRAGEGVTRLELLPPLGGLVLGGLIYAGRMAFKWTTEIVLTDKRFLYKTGVFSIFVVKMEVREINYCNVRQSLFGNIFDYGDIFMYTHTLDDKNVQLPQIAHPHLFSSEIERIKIGGPDNVA